MNTQILPKKRGNGTGGSPTNVVSSSGNASANSVSGGRRVISNRVLSKRTPSSRQRHSSFNEDTFEDAIHFNENKHTILSNFEEWIKLSTDNKITSKNSWQFQLIDYFHDMNVIKDGESINFQRALATLDGCVKIYLSRVESAATETGKLLSGLGKKQQETIQENEDEEEGDEDDELLDAKKKRKYNRVVESTLVPFDVIKIKKLEQELSIDPLFKKALAEFDEGGAKSLLLNTLSIDASGRVIFDATSNVKADELVQEVVEEEEEHTNPSILLLERFIFKDGDSFENLVLCPSLSEFHNAIDDVSKASSILSDFNSKINKEEQKLEQAEDYPEQYEDDVNDNYDNFENDNDNFDQEDPIDNMDQSVVQKIFSEPEQYVQSTVSTQIMDRDLMAYFDATMKANWRGPDHWKVAALKQSKNIAEPKTGDAATVPSTESKRKKNAQTIIDFFSDAESDDELFAPPKLISSITYKRNEVDDSLNKLPDDIKYTSARLTNLFTKPQVTILYFPKRMIGDAKPELTDENFFAEKYHQQEEEQQDRLAASFHQAEYEDYNNDFGGDDDFGEIDFNDALAGNTNVLEELKIKDEPEGSQFLGRKRQTEYLTFSRVAKRVDVKLLKDNLWHTIQKDEGVDKKTLGLVIGTISQAYPVEQRRDLSTSFYFICLLHLANEHDLTLTTNEAHSDLQISGFAPA